MIDLSYRKPKTETGPEPEELLMGIIVIVLVIVFGWMLGAAL